MSDDPWVAHPDDLEVGDLGHVAGLHLSVRYALKSAEKTPYGVSPHIRLMDSLLTPIEARALAALLREAAAHCEHQGPVQAHRVWEMWHTIRERCQ